ncbi:MAG: UvrD-helicase domain-containing protein, partial [Lachnospiraceae bacterium]|nr:UvrD-helicase domain-containing protein [Lachnospiraceae bacterium]
MAAFNWTKEQKQVIFTRDRNLLVSAAAGSGKTTVLVERVLQYLTDEAHPVDIDRLLIVTFTRAAASEMRTRLYKAISDRLREQPENRHLRRQLRLIGSAQISTIDSFCSWVLSYYYQEISLDPSFRVGDEGEMTLLKDDVLKKLLEEKYEEGSDEFLALSESFAAGKNDDELRERLLRLFSYSESAPYPDEWLQESLKPYYAESTDDLLESAWLKQYTESLKAALSDCVKKAEAILEICKKPMGPAYAYDTFSEDIPGIRRAAEAADFRDLQEKAAAITFAKKPNKPRTGLDPDLEKKATDLRDKLKYRIKTIREKTAQPLEETLAILKTLRPRAETFIGLTRDFARAFAAEKRKRNLVDYSDLEHLTIQILKQDGKRTAVARLLSKRFEEIMVDEYQDSNFVQEEILTAVSRMEEGHNNIFMVGDMKQSIYRFRMARPELFTEKYETYTREDSDKQLIELDNNFRSGTPVIDSVNEVFRLLMHKSVGGIEYNAAAELKIGPQKEQEAEKAAVFDRTTQFLLYVPEEEDEEETGSGESTGSTGSGKPAGSQSDALNPAAQISKPTEKINGSAGKADGPAGKAKGPADSPGEDLSEDQDERTGIEKEAVMTALEILKLTSSGTAPQIYDESLKAFRPVSYGDIVILLRSSKNTDTIFAEALEDAGIPVYLESRQGYFETWEVRLVLDFLRVIDNPVQDIPLASLMHSMLFSFTSEEMAEIAVS